MSLKVLLSKDRLSFAFLLGIRVTGFFFLTVPYGLCDPVR